jgi:predicted nucleic acid-binding protein
VEPLILDAGVLIGLLDSADAHHTQAVEDIDAADRAGHELLVPASAYSETLVAFARADRLGDARDTIAAMGIRVAPLTETMAEAAAELRARHEHLRLPDALALACARSMRGRVLSYDPGVARLAGPDGPLY